MAALLSCSSCGRSQQLDDKWIGKSGKCPGCGSVVQAVASPPPVPIVTPQPVAQPQQATPWREDNWGIASVALAFFAFWFLASTVVMLTSFASGAAGAGVVAALCSKTSRLGVVGLLLNLVVGALLVVSSTLNETP